MQSHTRASMNFGTIISSIATILFLPSCIASSAGSPNATADATTFPIGDSTAFFSWYVLPLAVRKEIINALFRNEFIPSFPAPIVVVEELIDYDRIIKPSVFLAQVRRDEDWIGLVRRYFTDTRKYNLKTKLHLMIEIFKNATPATIQRLLEENQFMNFISIFDLKIRSSFVELITESRSSGKDIISILKILEHKEEREYDSFNVTTPENLQLIRDAAFRLDDSDLMKFTDRFPDLINPSSTCQKQFIDSALIGDQIPKLWDMICTNASSNSTCQVKSKDEFVKFKLFDKPVNTKGWHPAMWAIASQDFKKAQKIPVQLLKHSSGQVPTGSITIQQMVQMIPDDLYRENIRKSYKKDAGIDVPSYQIISFNAIGKNGQSEVVRVLVNREQNGAAVKVAPKSPFDTEAFAQQLIDKLEFWMPRRLS